VQNINKMYIVELEKGVWLAPGQGDPARTLKIENAKQYKRKNWAKYGLKMARNYRPFEKAKIKLVDECALANER
jgi:hypothetical protein